VLAGVTLLASRPAHAQLRWDVGAQAGVTKRFTTGATTGAPSPGFGPSFGLQGHVALVPMVRIGLYFEGDVSPTPPLGPRTFWAGGLHLRIMPPLLGGAWRTWVFAGLGYAYVDWGDQNIPASGQGAGGAGTNTRVTGGIFDAPVGLGLGRKVGSWLIFGELGTRFGFGFYGPMYAGQGGAAGQGQDSFALSASVGLSLEQ
jgi:hypothetical protein